MSANEMNYKWRDMCENPSQNAQALKQMVTLQSFSDKNETQICKELGKIEDDFKMARDQTLIERRCYETADYPTLSSIDYNKIFPPLFTSFESGPKLFCDDVFALKNYFTNSRTGFTRDNISSDIRKKIYERADMVERIVDQKKSFVEELTEKAQVIFSAKKYYNQTIDVQSFVRMPAGKFWDFLDKIYYKINLTLDDIYSQSTLTLQKRKFCDLIIQKKYFTNDVDTMSNILVETLISFLNKNKFNQLTDEEVNESQLTTQHKLAKEREEEHRPMLPHETLFNPNKVSKRSQSQFNDNKRIKVRTRSYSPSNCLEKEHFIQEDRENNQNFIDEQFDLNGIFNLAVLIKNNESLQIFDCDESDVYTIYNYLKSLGSLNDILNKFDKNRIETIEAIFETNNFYSSLECNIDNERYFMLIENFVRAIFNKKNATRIFEEIGKFLDIGNLKTLRADYITTAIQNMWQPLYTILAVLKDETIVDISKMLNLKNSTRTDIINQLDKY